ncbi:tRNA-splicing endonuclease subunit Sen54 [Fasciola gigantica]|uniref:tRNA-splicing endonuclease subunit Sen54 n=1 Tax=Fasciola gigantica TaxID=46835 RepID=A0A504YEI1_FASGI|nr:tRNA-splicing endonuclease subunit Sen54 [Fasciola gigantica]
MCNALSIVLTKFGDVHPYVSVCLTIDHTEDSCESFARLFCCAFVLCGFLAEFLIGKELAVRCEAVNYPSRNYRRNRKRIWPSDNLSTDEESERVKYFAALSQEYASTPSRMSHGIIVNKFVQLTKMRGKYYRFMGFMQDGKPHLHPFEALFLSEGNKLQVWDHGLPVSIQQMYDQLLDAKTYSQYLVYVRLSRLGFILRIRNLLKEDNSYEELKVSRQSLPSSIHLSLSHIPLLLEPEKIKNDSSLCIVPTDLETISRPNMSLSSNQLMENLQDTVKSEHMHRSGLRLHDVLFDAYGNSGSEKEGTVNFSKRSPIPPDFLVSVSHPDQPYPDLAREDLLAINVNSTTELVHCIVDGSDVFFHSVKHFQIPSLMPKYDAG